uniref:Nucleoprotein TPR n=1 Tax=Globodera pallida TaxID=36090 RepID=A0A183BST9_GLOPA
METADSSVGEQLKSIDEQKRIAQLEHEIFTVCKQLDEKSEKFKDVQDQNALLKDRLGTLEQEKLDAACFTESLVKSRDSLIQEKTGLQNDRLCLEKRKDELELQVSKLTNEKRRHLDDIDQLRNKSDKLFGERTELQTQIDDFHSEKALIAYDKEQWSREKEILLMSKQWYMNEITDREQKINELRIQLIKEQSEMQRELSLFDERTTELTAKAEQLQENLLEREDELNTVRDQFKKSLNDQTVRVNELEAELRARERLANVYKANNEAASAEIAELTEHELRLQMQLKDAEQTARYNNERMTLTLQEVEAVLKRVEAEKSYASESQLQSALLERDNLRQLVDNLHDQNAQLVNGLKANLSQACSDRDKALAEVKSLQSNINALDNVYQRLKSDHEKLREEMEQIQSTDTNVEACKKEIQKLRNTVAYQEKQIAEWDQKCEDLNQTIERKDKQMEDICRLGADMENSIEYGTIERQRMQAVREQLEKDLSSSNKTIEELRNELAGKEMELLNQAKSLSEVINKMEDQRSKYEQEHLALEKSRHEAQLKVAQFQAEIENLRQELELKTATCAELSETNLRLITDLAREMGKTEEFERKVGDSNNELSVEREKHQQSLEKLRLNDEIKDFITRDEDHVQKQSLYLDEIQKLVQQNSFMERLNQTIASPASSASLNASFNAGTPNTSRLSVANTSQQQQQSDRMNVIIGYMRTEKQKETELRMNAELELQRIRTQTSIDQHKIAHMETEVAMLRTEAETGARVAVEKAQLLAQLNVLREVQSRYQQLKKTSDEVNQRYAVLEERKRELEQTQLMAQADKRNLEAQLDAATKELNSRTQENKNLLERYNKAMLIASKYSPELVNTLQGDNEKLRSSVAQREKEVELLNKEGERLGDEVKNLNAQLTELKTKGEKLSSELSAVKGFARKFRDERNKLEQEKRELEADLKGKNEELVRLRQLSSSLEAAAASAEPLAAVEPRSPVSSTAGGIVPGAIAAGALSAIRAAAVVGDGTTESLRRRLEQVTKEKQELVDKVKKLEEDNKNLQRELDEANEKVTRMDMVEKLLKATQKKITDFASDVNRLRAENEQLKQRVVELEEEGQRLQQFEENEQLKKQLAELEEDAQLMEDNMEQHIGVEEGQPEMPMPNPPMTPEPDQMSPESFGLKLDNLEDEQDVVVEDEEGEEEYGDEEEEYDEDEEEDDAEEEVLNEEDELSRELGSGEPPLKQRRMHGNASQDEAAGDAAKKDDSAGADGGDDDDDDDEIQLL